MSPKTDLLAGRWPQFLDHESYPVITYHPHLSPVHALSKPCPYPVHTREVANATAAGVAAATGVNVKFTVGH